MKIESFLYHRRHPAGSGSTHIRDVIATASSSGSPRTTASVNVSFVHEAICGQYHCGMLCRSDFLKSFCTSLLHLVQQYRRRMLCVENTLPQQGHFNRNVSSLGLSAIQGTLAMYGDAMPAYAAMQAKKTPPEDGGKKTVCCRRGGRELAGNATYSWFLYAAADLPVLPIVEAGRALKTAFNSCSLPLRYCRRNPTVTASAFSLFPAKRKGMR